MIDIQLLGLLNATLQAATLLFVAAVASARTGFALLLFLVVIVINFTFLLFVNFMTKKV